MFATHKTQLASARPMHAWLHPLVHKQQCNQALHEPYNGCLMQIWCATPTGSCRSEDLSDCLISTEDGKSYPAHKLALASASPVLKAMFTSSSSMQDGTSSKVTIKEAAPEVVELLLQFMYGLPEVLVPVALAVAFFKLADQYQLTAATDALAKVRAYPIHNKHLLHYIAVGSMLILLAAQIVQQTRTCTHIVKFALLFAYQVICEDVTLTPDAVSHLLPQATQLGSVGTVLAQHLASRAAVIHRDIAQQDDFLQRWRLQDVQHVLTVMQLNKIEHVIAQGLGQKVEAKQQESVAYSSIQLAAKWTLGEGGAGCSGNNAEGTAKHGLADRVQLWPELQDKLVFGDIKNEEVKELIAEPGKPLQKLPGLAAAVVEVLVSRT